MIIVYGLFLTLLASIYAEEVQEEIDYFDELPKQCRGNEVLTTSRGEALFKHLASCSLEMIILKVKHPDFRLAVDIPDTPASDSDCTFSKLKDLETNEKSKQSFACALRGIIGKDPETITKNEMRKIIKKNSEDLLKTTHSYYHSLNCSSEQFKNIDFEEYINEATNDNDCLFIELIKHSAYAEELGQDEGNDTDGENNDEQTVTDNSDVMKVIEEQMKGILKLIKSSTGRDISDGNIIIAYTNVFEIKPSKE